MLLKSKTGVIFVYNIKSFLQVIRIQEMQRISSNKLAINILLLNFIILCKTDESSWQLEYWNMTPMHRAEAYTAVQDLNPFLETL